MTVLRDVLSAEGLSLQYRATNPGHIWGESHCPGTVHRVAPKASKANLRTTRLANKIGRGALNSNWEAGDSRSRELSVDEDRGWSRRRVRSSLHDNGRLQSDDSNATMGRRVVDVCRAAVDNCCRRSDYDAVGNRALEF